MIIHLSIKRSVGANPKKYSFVCIEREKIFSETMKLLEDKNNYNKMEKAVNPYRDGKASERIMKIIGEWVNCGVEIVGL